MNHKESHPIRNSAIASIIGGIALSFWPPFKEFLIKTALWCWEFLTSVWGWFSSSHQVYGWIILLFIALAAPSSIRLVSLFFKKGEPGVEDLYTSDYLFGAYWQWCFSNSSIDNLWCLCPSCKGELVYYEFTPDKYDYRHDGLAPKTDFVCERCNATKCSLKGNKRYALGTVEREIRRRIRNNEWTNN